MVPFTSTNPYTSLEVIVADGPEELKDVLKSISTPIQIVSIIPYGKKVAAFIIGNLIIKKGK